MVRQPWRSDNTTMRHNTTTVTTRALRLSYASGSILGDYSRGVWRQLSRRQPAPLPKIPPEIPSLRLGVLTLTDLRRQVMTLTVTDQRGGRLSENWY